MTHHTADTTHQEQHHPEPQALAADESTTYPRVRAARSCPLGFHTKDAGLLACWACYSAHNMHQGVSDAVRQCLDHAEQATVPAPIAPTFTPVDMAQVAAGPRHDQPAALSTTGPRFQCLSLQTGGTLLLDLHGDDSAHAPLIRFSGTQAEAMQLAEQLNAGQAAIDQERTRQAQPTRYDYARQAWIVGGRYQACAHRPELGCSCYGRLHAGELAPDQADAQEQHAQARDLGHQLAQDSQRREARRSVEPDPRD